MFNMSTYIYVLKLKHDKYYIGRTANRKQRMDNHFSGQGAKWTQLHKPKKIIEMYKETDIKDEYHKTIEYMRKYGWRNVRGAGFCQIDLRNPPLCIPKN